MAQKQRIESVVAENERLWRALIETAKFLQAGDPEAALMTLDTIRKVQDLSGALLAGR